MKQQAVKKGVSPLLQLPFDQYSRQRLALELIDAVRDGKKTQFSILDVGGYKGATAAFHVQDTVQVLDVFDVDEPNYIKGDATAMDFADGAFDFVVSFDVFEHIPRDRRKAFVSECTRVAKRGVIIAAPVGTPQNAREEVYLNKLFKSLHGTDHQWLKEHIDYKLPEPGLAPKLLREQKLHTFELPSNYLPNWLLVQSAIFAASKFDKVGKHIDAFYAAYNKQQYPDGTQQVNLNYRIVACGVKTQADAQLVEQAVRRTTPNDAQSFEDNLAVTEQTMSLLIGALDAFHSEVLAKDKELAELRGQLNQTTNDLVGMTQQRDIAKRERDLIVSSRSYRLARGLAAVKEYPKHLRKKGQ